MNLFNKTKYQLVRILPKKRFPVLFSPKYDWEYAIRHSINLLRHQPVFADFKQADVAAFPLVVPLTIDDLLLLHQLYPGLNRKTFLVPGLNAVHICDDKAIFYSFLQKHGYAYLLPPQRKNHGFPCVLKKRVDGWGKNCFIVRDKADENRYSSLLSSESYLQQEYVPGQVEYTTHILIKSGQVLFQGSLEFRFQTDLFIKGKRFQPASTRRIPPPTDLSEFIRILRELDFEGTCCFNYKLSDGGVSLFEINPRFPAWCYLAVGAGQNQTATLIELATGIKAEKLPAYVVGKMFIRHSDDMVIDMKEFETISTTGEL